MRRLSLALIVVAFTVATALPGSVIAMPIANHSFMAAGLGQPCDHCPPKGPATGGKMMPCGALTCAGAVIALPDQASVYMPAFCKAEYAAQASADRLGTSPPARPLPAQTRHPRLSRFRG